MTLYRPSATVQSLSRWHKQLSSATSAAHGERSSRRSPLPAAAAGTASPGEPTLFYGGLVNRSTRNAFSSPDDPLATSTDGSLEPLTSLPTHAKGLEPLPGYPSVLTDGPVDDAAGWLNTTTLLAGCCSPPYAGPLVVPWWTDDERPFPDGDCQAASGKGAPERGQVVGGSRGNSNVTTGERYPDGTRMIAADACLIELDTTDGFAGAEPSVTVHDVCNKTIDDGSGNGGYFSTGARYTTVSDSCGGGGTVAAASPSAAVATLGQQPQPIVHQKLSDRRTINHSSSSISLRGGQQQQQQANNIVSGARPLMATNMTTFGNDEPPSLLTSLLPDIDWPIETCLGTVSGDGMDGSNSRHLWLSSPNSSTGSSSSVDDETPDERRPPTTVTDGSSRPTVETSVDCGSLLDRLHDIAPAISLHEEIEQLSSAFDCDISNQLVSTVSTVLPNSTDPASFNIIKWLQDDIITPGSTQLLDTSSRSAGNTFENSLDRIHNICGLASVTRTIHEPKPPSTTVTTNIATTTSTKSVTEPQRDHTYYAMKRRLQVEDVPEAPNSKGGPLTKIPKLLPRVQNDLQVSLNVANNDSTSSKMPLVRRKAPPTLAVNIGNTFVRAGLSSPPPLSATILTTTTTATTTTTTHEPLRPLPQATTLNTPDLTNDILDLEDEKFDLLSFIETNDDSLDLNAYNSTVEKKSTLDTPDSSEATSSRQHTIVATTDGEHDGGPQSGVVAEITESQICQLLTFDKLRQLTSGGGLRKSSTDRSSGTLSSASSVCGDSSSDASSTMQRPKRRGRPPKAAGTVRDRAEYQHLSEADWRYREQRDKNNEASRKSRINRKDRELKLETEADRLSAQHQRLSHDERRLTRECQRWRKAVMKLALL